MSQLNINGGPVFVDVANDPQFPILYSHLLQSQDENASVDTATKSTKDVSLPAKHVETQPPCDSQTYQTEETSVADACIKIEKRRLKCPECKRFTCETEEKMLRHIRRIHRGENPFQCTMCEYSTYNKAVFEEHVRIHQGIKPFKCSYCDYRSASKKNAKKHERIHRSDNPMKCQICGFLAKNPSSYKAHQAKQHATESDCKTFYCKICQRQFDSQQKKRNHYYNKKKCHLCVYVTCSKVLLDKHMELEHGKEPALKKVQQKIFTCTLCPWSSNSKPRILLHLIHHPNQTVDEDLIDITVLRNCGIMT